MLVAGVAWMLTDKNLANTGKDVNAKVAVKTQSPSPMPAANGGYKVDNDHNNLLNGGKNAAKSVFDSRISRRGKLPGRFDKSNVHTKVVLLIPVMVAGDNAPNIFDSSKAVKPFSDAGIPPLKKNGTNTRGVNAKRDSAAEIADAVEKKDSEHIKVQAGLQWFAQIPPGSTQNYFAGPGGASQPYLLVLPGAWVSIQANRYLFMAEINPFATTVFNPKPFTTTATLVGRQTTKTNIKELNKLFGFSGAIRVNYNIAGNWWAGFGLQPTLWQNGVVTNRYSLDSGGIVSGYKTVGRLADSDWVYFSKFQLRTDAELMYKLSSWHAGLRAGFFFTPVARNYDGPNSPLQLELFFRWAPLHLGKHKKLAER
jgi:hypothetical protein